MASDAAPWRRLHAGSIAVNLLPRTWVALRGLWPLFVAALLGRRTDPSGFIDAGLLVVLLTATVGSTVLHWLTVRYRIVDGRLEIQSGALRRVTRAIDASKVQNVEVYRNVFHRLAGLAEVRVETASGREVEGLLSALSLDDATALVAALGGTRAEKLGDARVLVTNDVFDLMKYGATSTRFAQAAIGLSLALEVVQLATTDVRLLSARMILAVLPLVALGAWLAGTGSALLAHYGFTLAQGTDGRWSAEGGLFTRRRVEWRPHKVQLVAVDEPWLRRFIGLATVRIETAAASRGEGGTSTAEALVPAVLTEDVAAVIAAVSVCTRDPATVDWQPAHPIAVRRAIARAVLRLGLLTAFMTWLAGSWGLLFGLLIPAVCAFAWIDARTLGYALTDDALLVRGGYFRRETSILPRAKVQSATLLQPIWWRSRGIARLAVSAAGVQVQVPPIAERDARALLAALVA